MVPGGTSGVGGAGSQAIRRIVLVGFMGAGKTRVGRDLARRLGWAFFDFDETLEQRTGRSVPELFRERGESAFRELEAALTAEAADLEEAVIAPGGGWVTVPGALERLRRGSLVVWLDVSPGEAVRRIAGGPERPLLAEGDPYAAARGLLAARSPLYATADVRLPVDGRSVEEITAEVVALLRRGGNETGQG